MKETRSDRRIVQWLSAIALTLLGLGFLLGRLRPLTTWQSLLVAFTVVLIVSKFLHFADNKLSGYILGNKGEFKVWVILNEMYREGFRTLNNLELSDKGDVDHVVVGPTGVWAIESKFIDGEIGFVGGRLTRNGSPFKRDFLKQAHAEAFTVRDYLATHGFNIPVRPVLVFSRQHAKVRFGDAPIEGVLVIGSMYLRKIIGDNRHGKILEQEQIRKITEVLEAANSQ